MKCPSYDIFFNTISTPTRLQIIRLLQKKSMSVSEICEATKQEQSNISHNLKALSDCNIVDCMRQGKSKVYSLNAKTMIPLLKIVEEHVQEFCSKECCTMIKKPMSLAKTAEA